MLGFALAGCNALTGAGDYDLDSGLNGDGSGGQLGTVRNGQGGDGSGGQGAAAGTVGATGVAADGVSIERIELNQGVARLLMEEGAEASSRTPVVAGRPALIRVYYQTEPSAEGATVTARLEIEGEESIDKSAEVSGASEESELGSTINFEVPAASMKIGGSYRVSLLQAPEDASGDNDKAVFPTEPDAMASFGANAAPVLKVTLVPVRYGADSSDRLPDTSDNQKARYRDAFFARYPAANVVIDVHKPLDWAEPISAGGAGWGKLLTAVADLRQSDGVSGDTYYYGLFSPASSFSGYCSGACVAGLGFVGQLGSDYTRAAIGLGFNGERSLETALHEIGHAHGRSHAPCGGVSGADAEFPYPKGGIGSYGYDLIRGQLLAPSARSDMMGYCDPTWISDYTYSALFERMSALSGASIQSLVDGLEPVSYQRLQVGFDDQLSWMNPVALQTLPPGEDVSLVLTTAVGPRQSTARLVRYDHVGGGILFLPSSTPDANQSAGARASIDGREMATP